MNYDKLASLFISAIFEKKKLENKIKEINKNKINNKIKKKKKN